MNAAEIINEIKQLPPDEKASVLLFARALSEGGQMSGRELSETAAKLAAEVDPAKARALKDEIAAGFYGSETDA